MEKPVDLTPCTREREEAEPWLHSAEGVIAKQLAAPYRPGERTGMVKIKRVRTIDAVVCGWRPGKEEGTVGALILGLYNEDGDLRVVGHSSGLKAKEKRDLVKELAPYETGQRGSGEPSRWSQGRDLEWVELRPELVVEVSFDHVSAGRIRHGSKLNRWRQDKDPQGLHRRPALQLVVVELLLVALARARRAALARLGRAPVLRVGRPARLRIAGAAALRRLGPVAVAARLHPLGLAALLGEVRRPRRVAQAFGLVAVGERVQRVEPPRVRVDVGGRVADRGQALGHGVQAQLARFDVGHLVPVQRAGDAGVRVGRTE